MPYDILYLNDPVGRIIFCVPVSVICELGKSQVSTLIHIYLPLTCGNYNTHRATSHFQSPTTIQAECSLLKMQQ